MIVIIIIIMQKDELVFYNFCSACFQATSLGVSPLTAVAVVGIVTGHVHFVDLTNAKQPRVVRVIRLHHDQVRHIVSVALLLSHILVPRTNFFTCAFYF